jgi:hypothetical protein
MAPLLTMGMVKVLAEIQADLEKTLEQMKLLLLQS